MKAKRHHIWVDSAEGLAAAVKSLSRSRVIAVDTEADSFYHYFHKCCLIQISDGNDVFLIDTLSLKRPKALADLLGSSRICKVLHAAEQDILYLKRDFGFKVTPIFDTMIAAQLLGKSSVGLARLLASYFGSKLDKGCQRDDWSKRPLTDRQKAYAAEDVRQLIRLHDALKGELEECGRLEWGREEFEVIAARKREPRGFDRNGFWNLKGARDLEPAQTAVLRELYVMRDERARAADLPPFRILSDDALVALARRSPTSAAETEGIKGFTPLVRRRIGEQVLAAVSKGLAITEANRPKPPRTPGRRRSAAFRVRLERLRAWRKAKSSALGLDPGVLFPQMTLEALAASGLAGLEKPEQIQGLREWRRKLIQPEAATLLA